MFNVLRADRPRLVSQKTREKSVKKHPLFEPQSGEFGGFSFLNASFFERSRRSLDFLVLFCQEKSTEETLCCPFRARLKLWHYSLPKALPLGWGMLPFQGEEGSSWIVAGWPLTWRWTSSDKLKYNVASRTSATGTEPQPPAPRISHWEHLLPEVLEGNCFNHPQIDLDWWAKKQERKASKNTHCLSCEAASLGVLAFWT